MDLQDRGAFLNFVGYVLGGLALSAFGLSWLSGIDLAARLSWDWRALGWGLVGVLPLAGLFVAVYQLPWSAARTIREFLQQELAPSLAQLKWFDLILVAGLTGVAEELFFRGWLEPAVALGWVWLARGFAVEPLGQTGLLWLGRLVGSVLFGAAHLVTIFYGLFAFLVGVYLSWLQTVVEPNNLLIPIVTHAVYDYFGFVMIVRLYRSETSDGPISH